MTRRRVLVAHPSADVYGSDLQLLESVSALVDADAAVEVVLPADGPLVPLLVERGATVRIVAYPALRKAFLSPLGLPRLAWSVLRAMPALVGRHRAFRPDVTVVNTVTIPWWLLAARLTRTRAVCHVHEAEQDGHPAVLTALALPNLLAHRLITNSRAAATALTDHVPRLAGRITVLHNGVPSPGRDPSRPRDRSPGDRARLVLVGRLSPRKGIDVALEAVALLRRAGRDVSLTVGGSVFEGYEWFEQQLRARAAEPDLAGRIELLGYVSPTWPLLEGADVVLVPSRVEPFGNTAVEALLARRPLVASDTQGLAEIVDDGRTGLLAAPGDATSLADAVGRLLDDPALAVTLAETGHTEARTRFSTATYRDGFRRSVLD